MMRRDLSQELENWLPADVTLEIGSKEEILHGACRARFFRCSLNLIEAILKLLVCRSATCAKVIVKGLARKTV